MALYSLPNEILLIIINYLDMYSLMELKCVCKRFNSLIDFDLDERSNHLLVTNQMSEEFRKRCKPLLSSYSSKFITHYNWINGIYEERRIYASQYSSISGLQITQNSLCFSSGTHLYAYNRTRDGTVNVINNFQRCQQNFTSFACCNDVLISGHSEGNIRLWRIMESRNNKNYLILLKVHSNVHDSLIICLDATSEYIASFPCIGNSIKIHKYTCENDVLGERNEIFVDDNSYVTSVKFDPTETKVAWISAVRGRTDHFNYLSIYDINNQNCQNKFVVSNWAYPSELLWEDPYTILMYCTKHVKKIDIRTTKFIRIWNVPDDLGLISCFSSDNLYTIMTGTNNNKVILWDQRKNAPVQVYAVNKYDTLNNENNIIIRNEINFVLFDSHHLYIASRFSNYLHASNYIYEFDFKENNFDHEKMKAIYSTNFGGPEFKVQ